MQALEQYPHHLYRYSTGEAEQDGNGAWVQNGGGWQYASRCREETNGRGTRISTADEAAYVFSALIQIPVAECGRIPEGTRVIVTQTKVDAAVLSDEAWIEAAKESGEVRLDGTVRKYDVGRLHDRCWV